MKSFGLLCLFVFCAIQVHATTLLYKDFDALVTEAEGIVEGTVYSVESYYQNDEIYTFVTLEQLHVLHGSYDQDTLALRLQGGQVGEEIVDVYGSPQLDPNDRVILFLRENGKAMVPIVGWTQGVFRVVFDEKTGKEVICDHNNNRVFSIKGPKIIKERRYETKAQIFDTETGAMIPNLHKPAITDQGTELAQAFSPAEEGAASPGITTDDSSYSESTRFQHKPVIVDHDAISLQEFTDTIARRLEKKGKKSAPISSVNVKALLESSSNMESCNTGSKLDAAPRGTRWDLEKLESTFPKSEKDEPFLPKSYEQDRLPHEEQN